MANIAKRLKAIMEDRQLTAGAVAEVSGISREHVYKIISGERTRISIDILDKLASGLGVSVDFLMGRENPYPMIPIPLLGTIRAGEPLLAVMDAPEHIFIPDFKLPKDDNVFALRVRGESMSGDDLHDGDIAILHKDSGFEETDVVAVAVDGDEATLKRVHYFNGYVALISSNPTMPPENHKVDEIQVIGKLIGRYKPF